MSVTKYQLQSYTHLKTYSINHIHGINYIAQGLAHLAAVGVPHHGMQVHLPGDKYLVKKFFLRRILVTLIIVSKTSAYN